MRLIRTASTPMTAWQRGLMETPCGFTCTNGFSAYPPSNPTACVCNAPNAVCNGQCGSPGACPSSISPAVADRRRRWLGSGSCKEMGPGWAACGVFGGGARAWECVNTARDLESCECACPGVTTLHPRFFFFFRWRMRVPPDAPLAIRPGLYWYPRCRGRRLSVWEM